MKRRQKLQRREKLAADRRDRLAAESSKSTAAAAAAAAAAVTTTTTTTAAAAPQQVDIDSLDDPFSSRPPSRSASRASSTHSSQSEDSISPSASASQVREPPREGSSQLASALGGLPQQQQASSSGSASSSAAAPDAFVQPPPPVDALQPSPLHMLTLLGSQLLQHDQKSQQEEQIHEAGLSGIEELFNDLGDEAFEDEAAVVQNEHSSSRVASARPEGTPSSILQHSVAAFSDLKDGDDSTPKGPLTPLHLSQTLQRSLATVKVNTTAPSPSPLSPKMPSLAEHKSATRATDARKMLAQHLTKLFALSSASTAPSPALRVLSLHSTHLFRAGTLLTGTLYLTNSHILFYASLRPRAPGAVLQAGALAVARGTGWGWADEAHERHQGQAETSASADGNHGWSAVDSRSPDAVSAPQAGQSRGSFGAAGARLGALLRMPASAIGVGTSASAHQASTNSTSSSSDSARFGTTPTPSTPFGGVQPIQGADTGSQARTAASTAKSTPRRSAPRLRTRHFVLTPRSLSWYASERDPYFPIGQLDLRWIRSVHEGGTTVAEDESAADWYIEYVIPPGPRRVSVDNKRAGARHQIVEDEAERRYSLLLKAPSAEDAKAWCTVVRRAVLRAGGSKSAKVARNDAASGSGGFDVRNDSVRVSIPLRCIVDVEGSVGASGMTSGARQSKSTGKDKQRERDPSVPATVEQDEAEGRTLVIRVWDQDESVAAPTKAGLGTDTAEVAPLDEYYFVDVQRQHELWRRLESAISRIPSVTPSDAAPALEDGRTRASDALGPEEEDLSRTYTERTRSFSYPPSTQPPLPPRTILPRAVSGPAKRLASGLVHTTRPVAAGLGVGATSVKDFMGHQALGLVERVKEAWNVAPAGDDGEDCRGGRAAVAAGQAIPRSRSQSGSEDWQSDDMDLMDTSDEEAGPAADADMDLADSLSFSIVDLPSATPGGGDEDNSGVEIGHSDTSRSPQQRSDLDQHNLELFRRTFVLPLSLPSSNPSDSDPDILRSAINSPASRSIHSSDLERSTSAERLLATFSSASLYRVLPLAGRLFVSERFLCFRSAKGISSRVNAGIGGLAQGAAGLAAAVSNLAIASAGSGSKFPLQADGRTGSKTMPTAGSGAGGAATGGGRTLMMLPLVDVIGVASNRAYRYGHRGMVVTIRGHEE
ncbi:Sterol 3-beta-glucosyltransferase [Tilletia horrida]|nr:Sterol 3-beta-glucosyltransferase [Tilletia horrida]